MSEYHDRVQKAVADGFRAFLLEWLAGLPPDGWTGSAAQLEAAWCTLAAVLPRWKRPIVPAPAGVGRRLQAEVASMAAAGWEVGFRRTATTRTITISRRADVDKG